MDSFASIQSFFQEESDELRKLLLGGAGNNPAMILSQAESIAMKEDWLEQARNSGGDDPSPETNRGDMVCRVNTVGMNFAGLVIKSDAMIGTKLVFPNSDCVNNISSNGNANANSNSDSITDDDSTSTTAASSPEFQLTFIKDSQKVTGPRFLVFIFNKLTGRDEGKEGKDGGGGGSGGGEGKEQAVTSFSRFFAEQSSETEATFVIETSLDIAIKFPSLLMKILPVSKEKAEEQGSASVIKTLVKDTGASLERIATYYTQVSSMQNDAR